MDRLKQPSTWAGFGILFQTMKMFFPLYAPILDGLSAAAGSAAVAINEGNSAVK
jgi:hypothetical protein